MNKLSAVNWFWVLIYVKIRYLHRRLATYISIISHFVAFLKLSYHLKENAHGKFTGIQGEGQRFAKYRQVD